MAEALPDDMLSRFAHRSRQQEVHDRIQAAVENGEQKSDLVGVAHHLQLVAGIEEIELGEDVERADGVVGHKADGEEEEDEEGLLGGLFVFVGVGEVRLVLGHLKQPESDLCVGDDEHDEDEPEHQHHREVDVRLPIVDGSLLELETCTIEVFILRR